VSRLLDYYLHTARAADCHLARRIAAEVPVIGVQPTFAPDLPSREHAIVWMDVERLNLHAVADHAATNNRPGHAIALPAAMHSFLRSQGHWDEILTLHNGALNTARHTSNSLGEAGALTDLVPPENSIVSLTCPFVCAAGGVMVG
jgi:hypothetical protein